MDVVSMVACFYTGLLITCMFHAAPKDGAALVVHTAPKERAVLSVHTAPKERAVLEADTALSQPEVAWHNRAEAYVTDVCDAELHTMLLRCAM